MTAPECERQLERDPLGIRLSRVADPVVTAALLGRVTAGQPLPAIRRTRARRRLLALAALVAAAAVGAATPAGAAIGRAILPRGLQQWFGLVSGAPSVITRPANACSAPSPVPSLSPGDSFWYSCPGGLSGGVYIPWYGSLAQAQAQVTFQIRTATWLPAGLTLWGVAVFPPDLVVGHSVSVEYLRPGGKTPGPGIRINEYPGTQVGGSAVPPSAVQHVTVHGQPAVFVKGDYQGPPGSGYWTPSADDEELSWQRDGLTYDMTASGLHMTARDMVRIADSIQ